MPADPDSMHTTAEADPYNEHRPRNILPEMTHFLSDSTSESPSYNQRRKDSLGLPIRTKDYARCMPQPVCLQRALRKIFHWDSLLMSSHVEDLLISPTLRILLGPIAWTPNCRNGSALRRHSTSDVEGCSSTSAKIRT